MESLALYACRLDEAGAVLTCNLKLAHVLGQPPSSLSGRDFADLVALAHERPRFRQALGPHSTLQALPVEFIEATLSSPDGGLRRIVRWFLSPFDTDGGARGFLALGWDETAQVQMERFLLRLARVVDLTQEPIVIASERAVAEYVNPAFTTSTGYSPGEIIGRSLSSIVAVPEDTSLMQRAAELFRRGECWEGSLRLRRRDGSPMAVQARVYPVRNADKHTTHYICIARDLSRQRDLERQVEELQRLESLGTLANGLAHRFNNILAAISGQTELLMMSTQDETLRKRGERILEATRKGKEVVEQLGVFARKDDPRPRAADLVPVVRNAVNFIRAAQPRAITVTEQLPPESPQVMANTTEIHQVLLNLLTNALEAIGEQPGHIEVRMRTDLRPLGQGPAAPCVVIEVADDGPGIPHEIQHRIFEPFFTTRSLASASGMGLAISHGIVTRHGGLIECRSAPGAGALFSVVLPLLARTGAAQPSHRPGAGTARILLVDAPGYPLETGKRQLENLHHQVVALAHPEAALEALRQTATDFDLVLTCYKMPGGGGLEFVRQARSLRPGLPLVICAQLNDEVDLHEARRLEVDEILRKPIPLEQLSAVIQGILDKA
jgi:PAS domain S-box-containing protein